MDVSIIPDLLGNLTIISDILSKTWLSTLSNILVAMGTLVLAYYTYKLAHLNNISIKNSHDQLEELKRQNEIIKSQQNPYLQFSDLEFKKNIISLSVKNLGATNAYSVGVLWNLHPVKLVGIYSETQDDIEKLPNKYRCPLFQRILPDLMAHDQDIIGYISTSNVYDSESIEKALEDPNSDVSVVNELYQKGNLKDYYSKLIFVPVSINIKYPLNQKRIIHNGAIKQPTPPLANTVRPGEKVQINVEVQTFLYYFPRSEDEAIFEEYLTNHSDFPPTALISAIKIPVSFNELICVLKYNNIEFVNFIFKLVYKNQYRKCMESVFLKDFVFSVKEHNDLEQALNEGFKTGRFLTNQRDLENTLTLMSEDLYFGEIQSI